MFPIRKTVFNAHIAFTAFDSVTLAKSTQHLIIFTRYPEPGTTKTRLIPALGAQGAAELHRQLAEGTLSQARRLQASASISLEVRFTGGTTRQMQEWLGVDLTYRLQGNGDLGERMSQALTEAFQAAIEQAVIIGTDCPSLDEVLLAKAFDRLHQNDLVLGPAQDGGYYLIGVRCEYPELFTNIHWGSDRVFEQTLAIAQRLNLSIATLPELPDIDRPEDLNLLSR